MKKLLSAVLAMLMIMSTATFTGSVFALDTYTPDDGKPVVYVSSTGADSVTVFNDLNAAILAVDKLGGGYVVVTEDVFMGRNDFAVHTNMVTIRGPEGAVDVPQITLRHMRSTMGPLTFEDIGLAWPDMGTYAGTTDDNDFSLDTRYYKSGSYYTDKDFELIIGENVVVPTTGNFEYDGGSYPYQTPTLTGYNITINSGTFSTRLARYGNNDTITADVNLTLNGGTITGMGTASSADIVVNGDVNITVNGGSFKAVGFSGSPKSFTLNGDYNFTVNGGEVTQTLSPLAAALEAKSTVNGNTVLDIASYDGTVAYTASKFDVVYPTAEKISGTVTLDASTIKSGVTYLGTTDDAKVIINGDIVLSDTLAFKNITIENGTNGRIVANGKSLGIAESVKTAPNADGKYIDIVTGSVDGAAVAAKVQILAGTYNSIVNNGTPDSKFVRGNDVVTAVNDYTLGAILLVGGSSDTMGVELSDFTNGVQSVVKYSPYNEDELGEEEDTGDNAVTYTLGKAIDTAILSYVKAEYYLNAEEGDAVIGTKPYIVIGGNKIEAEQTLAAGWNILNFEISGNGNINSFKFYPYGDSEELEIYNKMYVNAITFSLIKDKSALSFADPKTDKWMANNGDYVPDMENVEMVSDTLVNPINRTPTGLDVIDAPFTNGMSVKVSPAQDATGVSLQYNVVDNENIALLRADFMPYVRVEYYVNAKDGDDVIGKKPTLTIPWGGTYEADEAIKDGWNAATFNIYDAAEAEFDKFTFKPYGDATLNEWNKLYIAAVTFSQTENKEAPTYGIPDIDKDTGDVNPYIFDPASLTDIPDKYAYLKEMPVVYYSNTGVYQGGAAGSVSSLTAYGDINKAIAALEAVGGGYIILTTDLVMNNYDPDNSYNVSKLSKQNNSISTHKNMIILRGIAAEKTSSKEMVTVGVGGAIMFNGPVWLQNVYFEAIGTNDEGLVSEELHYGTPGAGNGDVITRMGKWQSKKSNPGIGSSKSGGTPQKVDVSIHSGTFPGVLKLGGYYSGMTNSGNMYVNIEGGDLTGMTWSTNHSSSHTTEGSAYITISGGKFKNAISFAGTLGKMTSPVYIKGDLNVTITGGDFSAMAADSITANKYENGVSDGVYGTRTIDILGYEGDSLEKLRAAINDNYFDVLNVNAIYVSDSGDDNNNDGLTTDKPVKTIEKALEIISKGENENAKYSGKIVFVGNYTVDEATELPAYQTSITFNSQGSGKLILAVPLTIGGDSVFKNISIEVSDDGVLIANGNKLVMDTGVTVTGDLDIVGGTPEGTVASVNVTINSGTYNYITAGDSVEGDVNITINGGTITGGIIGGSESEDGEIGGSVVINITDGSFVDDSTIIATGSAEGSFVGGSAEVNISGGHFTGLNQVQPGNSETVGKTSVNYSQAPSRVVNELAEKVAKSFDVIVAPKQDAPVLTKKDKFIFIIKNIGDPTKALTKTIPFKVTQSAVQTHSPVVVSPAQLKLPINGGDHAILTIQPVNNVNTIRFTPNANFTKGSGIRVDGYNIKGRGVNSGKHKYAEIIYYYTVPEGQTPVAKKMSMAFYGNHSGIGTSYSTEFVANKWATVIIDLNEAFAKVEPADVTQYHLGVMCNENGTSLQGSDIPAGQYLDIVSMTFYSEMPKTTITGGNSPSADIPEDNGGAETAVVATVEDINVKLSQIKSAVNGLDSFTATEKMFDGLAAVEYIPNRSYNGITSIEGYGTTGKKVSSLDYQYVILKMYLKTDTTMEYTPIIATQTGGLSGDPNPVKSVNYSAEKPLVPNQWNTVVVRITPANTDNRNFMQVHIRPFGSVKNETLAEGDVVYIAEMTYSARPPKAEKTANEEVVEEEAEIIAESPAVVVAPEKLVSSATSVKTFKSTLGEFDGKKVVMIKANKVEQPLTIDGAAIFGETEQTPGGALSLETHRYAVISYYYATSDAETTRAPEFDLLGGRIQTMENVINGVTAKGEALKVNQWATAVVKLTGNGSGKLTSGFYLRPFGSTVANNIASGDVLYIENITFVSNRP